MTHSTTTTISLALSPICWELPATWHQAVYAFSEHQVLSDHSERAATFLEWDPDPEIAVEALCLAGRERAVELARILRGPMSQKQRALFANADLVRLLPDQIAHLPRATWLMGVLGALTGVEAAYAEARVCSRTTRGTLAHAFESSVGRHAAEARRRWEFRLGQMLDGHPWIRLEKIQVQLIGLETKEPRFRITGCR